MPRHSTYKISLYKTSWVKKGISAKIEEYQKNDELWIGCICKSYKYGWIYSP